MKNSALFFLILLFGSTYGQDKNLMVELSVDSVLMGNYFEVKFTVENASVKKFEPPSFEGFTIVGGPNHASSFSMINGEINQSSSYSYFLEPQDIGNFFIKPAMVDTGEEILESIPLEVIVLENPNNLKQDRAEPLKGKFPPSTKEELGKPLKPKKKRKVYKI